jgi:hypothetical protein
MSATVNATVQSSIVTNPFAALPTALGLIAILLMVSLLIQKEFFRAQQRQWSYLARSLDTAVIPLGLAVIYIFSVRMLRLMGVL